MPLTDLNHFLVLTKDIEQSRRFYVQALGMREAPRPWAPFPGCWLAIGEHVCVHLAQANDDPEMLRYFDRTPGASLKGSGAVDHIAFYASDMGEFEQRLRSLDIPFRRRSIPQSGLEQIFVADPDGVTIELNFPGATPASLTDEEHAGLDKAAQPGAPAQALYGRIADIARQHLQPVVFSINARIGDSMTLERVYSSAESAYPSGGRKNKEGTRFGQSVLLDSEVLASEGPEAIRQHFDDHERILGLGGNSLLNVPVMADGVCVGVLNAVLPGMAIGAQQVEIARSLAGLLAAALQSHSRAAATPIPA